MHLDTAPSELGSEVACAVLRVLHRHRRGCNEHALSTLTGFDSRSMRPALRGLMERNRIRRLGVGDFAIYVSVLHAGEAAR